MTAMANRGRVISGVGAGLLGVAGVMLVATAANAEHVRRGQATFDAPSIFQADLNAIDATVTSEAASLPPAGDGMLRPAHFSVCAVIVSIRQMHALQNARLGGLHGP